MAVAETRARLLGGYYNSNPLTVANPGGLASGGHQLNFPQALRDLGEVLIAAAADAQAFYNAQPQIQAAVAAVAGAQSWAGQAQTYAGQALTYRNQAQEIVGTDLTQKANVNSPALTGTPTSTTPAQADNSTRIATTSYVVQKFAALVGAAPGTLDTLNELATALGNDPNFAATIASQIGAKFDKVGGVISGDVTIGAGGRQLQLKGSDGAIEIVRSGGGAYVDFKDSESEDWDARIDCTANDLVLRSQTGSVKVGTYVIYHQGNLSPVDLGTNQTVTGHKAFQQQNSSVIANASIVTGAMQVLGTAAGAAMMSFQRLGQFGAYFGLDTDNQLKLGGWSWGANAFRIWHDGNDGAGSGLDADLLRGAAPSWTPDANSIVKRDVDGSIQVHAARFNEFARFSGNGGCYWETYGGGWHMNDADWVRVYNNKGVATAGRMSAAGYNITSDRRLKSNIAPLLDVGALVDRLGVYSYEKGGRHEWGVIAQELAAEARLAHLVGDAGEVPSEGEPPLMTVDTNGLLALALAELKDLRRRVATLEAGR